MAKNITLQGASYSDVPAVTLPQTGGGTAIFSDPSVTTAVEADVASGKIFLKADGSIGTGTASGGGGTGGITQDQDGYLVLDEEGGGGGGGVSNVVTGTFTGTTTGVALEVPLSYTGNGYPVALLIYSEEGSFNSSGDFYNNHNASAIAMFMLVKADTETQPTYTASTSDNAVYRWNYYSSSASPYFSSSGSSGATPNFYGGNATSSYPARIKDVDTLSVYISEGGTSGFMAGIPYVYTVVYSS